MFGVILKATKSSFKKGMPFCRSMYVKKVMKLLAFIFEQPSYKSLAKSTLHVVQKLHICEKVYFDQLIFQFCFYYSFTVFYCVIFYSLDAEFFQYHHGVKQFGSRPDQTFYRA